MVWNIAPECVSATVLMIIWIYSRKGNVTPSFKNLMFQLCIFVTFLAMISNILAIITIFDVNEFLLVPAWILNTIYFIATPLMGVVYYFYAVATIYEDQKLPVRLMVISAIPSVVYTLCVLSNPWTKLIYNITIQSGYERGPLLLVTYLLFFLYCIICVILVIVKRNNIEKKVRYILFLFPMIAALVIIIQSFIPSIILTGSAATIALLLIYLYMQNKQISIDFLTGLANRQEFLNNLKLELGRNHPKSFTILIVSLKDFRRINDLYGQQTGDATLVEVGQFLKNTFKLGSRNIFRYSGDEFAIALKTNSSTEVSKMTDKIVNRFKDAWNVKGYTCLLHVAIGAVEYPGCAETEEQIINGIEFSINLAKKDTLNKHICYCSKEILENVTRRQQIAEILQETLDCKGFEVHYQPIYTIETKTFTMAEALLRIPNSPIGPLYPDEFIPIAEESGLIIDITYYVLNEVCHLIHDIKEMKIPLDIINVNFPPMQFLQLDLMDRVIEILKKHDIDGSQIKIEITESTLSTNDKNLLDCVLQLKCHGVKLGLDDFGTGYSNLSSVLIYPIDTIKLDKSLVWSAMKHEESAIVVRNITKTFNQLGLSVVAEGVETQAQSDFVESCGCDLIQGYLYAKPMNKEKLIQFMKAKNII